MHPTAKNLKNENPNVLITGGSGFLGKNIVKELLDPEGPLVPGQIRVFDIKSYEGKFQNEIGFVQGDVRDYEKLAMACEDVDLIIHAAAVIDWGAKDPNEVLSVNVGGTENVIRACRERGVQNLIYTSSLDAVYTGKPLVNINEDQDYPKKPHNAYCQSKLESEQLVLKANGTGLRTSVLRPSDIYGEEDPYHIDPLIEMAQNGFYTRLGNGKSKCQHVYVGNMAMAHIQLAQALLQKNSNVFGKVYFITDGPGYNFFSFFDRIVVGAGYTIWPKNFWLPKEVALPLAGLTELSAFVIRPFKRINVQFNRFAVSYTCTDFTFSSERAQQDFNFRPKYTPEESLERTSAYYRALNKNLKWL